MKSFLILALFVALAKGSQAKRLLKETNRLEIVPKLPEFQPPSNRTRIAGGEETKPHSRPYQVALLLSFEWATYFCGGSLISENYVLTAAHCLDGAISITVGLGIHSLFESEPTQIYVNAKKFFAHKEYDQETLKNDVGIIELESPVTLDGQYIDVIKLPTHSDVENKYLYESATLSGWGLASGYDYFLSPVLQEVEVEVITNLACYLKYNLLLHFDVVHPSAICTAGYDGVGACSGDSGGPLVVGDTLIGIVSFAFVGYCEHGFPSGYSRVTSYLDWIEENTDIKISP